MLRFLTSLFARSATATCQKFPAHWGGDCYGTYESIAETLRGGLSLALSGFAFWSNDIGGFEINVRAIPLSLDDGSSGLNVIM